MPRRRLPVVVPWTQPGLRFTWVCHPELQSPVGRSALRWGWHIVLRTVIRVVLIFVGTLFVGILGTGVGIVWPNITLATVLRSVFVIALVLAMTLNFRLRDKKAVYHPGRPDRPVLPAAGASCVQPRLS